MAIDKQYPISSGELKNLLRMQLRNGSGVKEFGSIFIWGQPGIGKSQTVAEVAAEEKVGLVDFRLTLCDPTDLRGIPIPVNDEKNNKLTAKWIPPDELPVSGKGILFFDDFPTAPPLVQAAAYQIAIQPHQLGQYKLPEGWVIVAAGNTLKDRSLAHKMPKALSNRFTHLYMEADVDSWVEWATKSGISPTIIAFIKFKPDFLHKFNPASEDDAFATPRSWEMVSKALSEIKDESLLTKVIAGQIGQGIGIEFNHFLKIQNKLPPLDTIFNGSNFVPPESDPGLRYSLIVGLAMAAKDNQFNRLIEYSMLYQPEFAVLMLRMLISKNQEAVRMAPATHKWVQSYPELMKI